MLLLGKRNLLIFQMCVIRRTLAYPRPNMINFHAVDFSEHRSEEVILKFLLTLSVYVAHFHRMLVAFPYEFHWDFVQKK